MEYRSILLLTFVLGLCRPQDRDFEEQNDADEPNDEEPNDEVRMHVPPTFISQSQNLTVEIGESVTLPCDVKDLGDVPVMWTNGTSQLFLGNFNYVSGQTRISRAGNGLVIGNVSPADSGIYSCKLLVSNELKPSIQYRLQVKLPAAIKRIQPSGKQVVQKGNTLSLKCEVAGFPTPHVKWIQRHRKNSEDSIEHDGHELTIANVNREHSGVYECVADNGLNVAKSSVEVTVLFEPEIKIEDDLINTAENVLSELICIVHGHPTPKVKWFKEMPGQDTEILNGPHHNVTHMENKHILRIERTSQNDFGIYYCRAENDLGDAKKKIQVSGKPLAPTIIAVAQQGRWSKFTWQIVSSSPILKYELTYWATLRNEKMVTVHPPVQNAVSANIYQLEYVIPDLNPTSYEASLRAQNVYGWSEPSNKQIFVGDFRVPESPPNVLENMKSKDGSSAGVQMTMSVIVLLVTLVASLRC